MTHMLAQYDISG